MLELIPLVLHSWCMYRFHGNQSTFRQLCKICGGGCWTDGMEVSLKVDGEAGRPLLFCIRAHKTSWLSPFTGDLSKQTDVNLSRAPETSASTLNFLMSSPSSNFPVGWLAMVVRKHLSLVSQNQPFYHPLYFSSLSFLFVYPHPRIFFPLIFRE